MAKSKALSLISAILASSLLLSLPSCGKKEDNGADELSQNVVLTGVFRGTEIVLPENYYFNNAVTPILDGNTLTAMVQYSNETENEDGTLSYESGSEAIVYDLESGDYTSKEFVLGDNEYMSYGVFRDDNLVYISGGFDMNTQKESYYINTLNLTDGAITKSDEISVFFDTAAQSDWFYVTGMAVDADGCIYVAADSEIVVFDSSFIRQFSVTLSGWINSIAADGEGNVCISTFDNGGNVLKTIDKNSKGFAAEEKKLDNNVNNISFGKEYDIYYSNENGVYGMNFGEEPVMTMNYINSDVGEPQIIAIPDSETVIGSEYDESSYTTHVYVYRHVPDIDLSASGISIIEVAFGDSVYSLTSTISAFNKTHDDARVVALDYSVYSTEENYEAGIEKLTTDILTGVCKPDVVIGNMNDSLCKTLYSNGIYTDLLPLMGDDADDVFGCVKNTFATENGGIWGLCEQISVTTLAARRDVIGDRTSWTISEMLDYAKSLPEGTKLISDLSRANASYNLLGINGYGAFVDTAKGTCSFDSEDFISYLEYLKLLPEDVDYDNYDDYRENKYKYFMDGSIVLDTMWLYDMKSYLEMQSTFGTDDITIIGYPTAGENSCGSCIGYSNAYVITSYCGNASAAYDFISSALHNNPRNSWNIPVFKSDFMEVSKEYTSCEFTFYYDGSASWGDYDPENPTKTEDLDRPGIVVYMTDEDVQEFADFLDGIGCPLGSYVSDDITSIVSEETSAFLAGQKSATDCANVIQSRVSIWLSEHAK